MHPVATESDRSYPALRALFKRAFSGGSMRTSLERLGQLSPDEAPRVAEDIRALLAAVPAEKGLRRMVLEELGGGYDPRGDGGTVKSWLQGLMRHCDSVRPRSLHGSRTGVRPGPELQAALAAEIERIGVDELSERTMLTPAALLDAARGGKLDDAARRAFYAYEFGAYPDLAHLLGGNFYEGWEEFSRSWTNVVDGFVDDSRPGRVRGVLVDLDEILEEDDAALDAALAVIGGEHIPVAPAARRAWLTEVRERIAARIAA